MIDYKNTAFPKSEYDDRISRVQQIMRQKGIDLLVCHEIGNICWLCGIQCVCWNKYFMFLIPEQGESKLLLQSFELYNAYLDTWLNEDNIVTYSSGENGKAPEDPIESSISLIKDMGFEKGKIGIEYSTSCPGINAYGFERLKHGLDKAEIINISGLVENVRTIKSCAELQYIKLAASIASSGVVELTEKATTGMSDNDLAAIALKVMTEQGSEYMSLDPIVTIGPRSGVPHTTYGRHEIKNGDTGLLEISACINRYSGVTMRTISFGTPSDEVKFMIEGCIDSVNTVIENIRSGAVCGDIADKAEAKLKRHLKKYMWHGLYGYTIGLGFPPRWEDSTDIFIKKGYKNILEANMVFHVSTTLRDLGKRSVTISETVAVTESGSEVYTRVPRKLLINGERNVLMPQKIHKNMEV